MFQYKFLNVLYFLFHLTGQKRARNEAKRHFRLQPAISKFSKGNSFLFVYDRAVLISEAFTGKYLPARYRIGGIRHSAVFFLGFRPSLRNNPLIALSASGTCYPVTWDRYVQSSTADSRNNTVINHDPGKTLWSILRLVARCPVLLR